MERRERRLPKRSARTCASIHKHPYTKGLLARRPPPGGCEGGTTSRAIPGSQANLSRLPEGCAFAPRCAKRYRRSARAGRRLKPESLPAIGRAAFWCHPSGLDSWGPAVMGAPS
ncbi:MAG: hypothetical protein JO283_22530 [Bradyrhizobium sp.]|nr:hypothetical protein [Bradyrhizobium sp.]